MTSIEREKKLEQPAAIVRLLKTVSDAVATM